MKATGTRQLVGDPALAWSQRLEVDVGGARALVDATCALAAGATCLSDIEAVTAQEEIFSPGGEASDSTMLRALDELAQRLDATLVEAASPKAQAARIYKQGFGFHPLTTWCSDIGDSLAVMLRPDNAGSFTACDHIAVLAAAFGQIPAAGRTDVLVRLDGADASHEIINYLNGLNTAAIHGNRGRRVEHTIGWPVDERTLTGILRAGSGADRPATWPTDLRVIARRVPRPVGKHAKLELGIDPAHRMLRIRAETILAPPGAGGALLGVHRGAAV